MTDNQDENNCKWLIFLYRYQRYVYSDQSDEDSDEISFTSTNSFVPIVQEDEESLHRTSSSLNNYSILPPIKSAQTNQNSPQQYFLKHLQEKYQQNEKNGLSFSTFLFEWLCFVHI